jgi:hypothetical protein
MKRVSIKNVPFDWLKFGQALRRIEKRQKKNRLYGNTSGRKEIIPHT